MTDGAWLVTGASGFLGRHLLTRISAEAGERRVVALVRRRNEWEGMAWTRDLSGVDAVIGTVTESDHWTGDDRLRGLSGIVHLAALVRHSRKNAGEVYATNVSGTGGMVRLAARYGCRMVFVSTSGTVGCFRTQEERADEHAAFCENEVARWPYYHSKIMAEQESRRLATALGVDLVILRPPVLLGPGDHRFRSTGHLIRFLQGKLPFVIRGGMHFADVRDAAAAIVRVMVLPRTRPVYHLPGTSSSIEEFFTGVAAEAGRPAPGWVVPYLPAWWLARLTAPLHLLPDPVVVEMAAHWWGLRSLYAAEDLGYQSRPGAETLRDTVEWLRTNHPALSRRDASY